MQNFDQLLTQCYQLLFSFTVFLYIVGHSLALIFFALQLVPHYVPVQVNKTSESHGFRLFINNFPFHPVSSASSRSGSYLSDPTKLLPV